MFTQVEIKNLYSLMFKSNFYVIFSLQREGEGKEEETSRERENEEN